MRFPIIWSLVLSVPFLLPACAGSGSSGARGPQNVITFEQIADIPASDAYDVVQTLRPRWLRSRGAVSLQEPGAGFPVVYVGATRFGDLESLRQISASSVEELRLLSAADATTRYGTGHAGGVILVTFRR